MNTYLRALSVSASATCLLLCIVLAADLATVVGAGFLFLGTVQWRA